MALGAATSAFKGIQVAVAFLILRAGARLILSMPKRPLELATCAAAAGLVLLIDLLGWRFSTVWLILGGAALGFIARRSGGEEDGR